jgi:hypothetical protein
MLRASADVDQLAEQRSDGPLRLRLMTPAACSIA